MTVTTKNRGLNSLIICPCLLLLSKSNGYLTEGMGAHRRSRPWCHCVLRQCALPVHTARRKGGNLKRSHSGTDSQQFAVLNVPTGRIATTLFCLRWKLGLRLCLRVFLAGCDRKMGGGMGINLLIWSVYVRVHDLQPSSQAQTSEAGANLSLLLLRWQPFAPTTQPRGKDTEATHNLNQRL